MDAGQRMGLSLSEFFNEASGTTDATSQPPAAPSNLTVGSPTAGSLTLTWTDNAANETGFRIERKTGAGSYAEFDQVGADVTSSVDATLAASTTYTYRVRATNADGDSSYSNEASGTTTSRHEVTGYSYDHLYRLTHVDRPGTSEDTDYSYVFASLDWPTLIFGNGPPAVRAQASTLAANAGRRGWRGAQEEGDGGAVRGDPPRVRVRGGDHRGGGAHVRGASAPGP